MEPTLIRLQALGLRGADLAIASQQGICVAELKLSKPRPHMLLTVSRRESPTNLNLLAICEQAANLSEASAEELLLAQWPFLQRAFDLLEDGINMKSLSPQLSQNQILEHCAAHIVVSLQIPDEASSSITVVQQTANLWHFVRQFGSSKPAEVLALALNAQPRTINARLTMARTKGLLNEKLLTNRPISQDFSKENRDER